LINILFINTVMSRKTQAGGDWTFDVFCKYWKSVKWYDEFVQNLVTVTQIHPGLCKFVCNAVQVCTYWSQII